MAKARKKDVFVTRKGKTLARFSTVAQAEKYIAAYEVTDPHGVQRGDYGIDASERKPSMKKATPGRLRHVTGPDKYGSLYVYLRPANVAAEYTIKAPKVLLDYDGQGRLLGIELLEIAPVLPIDTLATADVGA